MNSEIKNFFYPKSVCVVGASSKEKNIGYEILNSIVTFGYKGKVFPVNPKSKEILGYKTFPSIREITENIDLAVVVVPKRFVYSSLEELIEKNVKSVIIVTAGFKETGKEGAIEEEKITALAKKHNVRIVGPNCMAVINSLEDVKLNATFVAEKPKSSPVAFLSQSGALGAAVINFLRESDIRFAHFISVGNKADVNENDLLKFWEGDKNISATTYYLESFVNGFEFVRPFFERKIKKPAFVLKAGRSKAGMKAAASHTGALGSSDKVVDAVLRQAGVVRVETIDELFDTAKSYINFPLPKGRRVAVVTNAGGPAILTTDALEKYGLALAEFSQNTIRKLRKIVPPAGSVNNPVDLLPGGTAEMYKAVNEVVIADKNVDAVISIFVEPVMVEPLPVVNAVNSIESKKPVYQVVMPLPEFWQNYFDNAENYKPLFRKPEMPAKVIANLVFLNERKNKLHPFKKEFKEQLANYNSKSVSNSVFSNQKQLYSFAKKYGIPVTKNLFVKFNELKKLKFNSPVVLKAISKGFTHKSEFNAVKLGINSKKELIASAKEMIANIEKQGFAIDEFLIQPMIDAKFELLIGGFRDVSFGPIIMFGQGGKYVEQINDISIRSAFLSEADALEMINETKIGKIISGVRGEKSIDINKLVKIILAAAKMLRENENIKELDINPLIVDYKGKMKAVDIRIG